MKIQINASGAWRQIIEFEPALEAGVRRLAVALVSMGQYGCKLRILDAAGSVVTCAESPDYAWKDR